MPSAKSRKPIKPRVFLLTLRHSGSSRRRHSSFAYRRACPGGGVTKQLPGSPPLERLLYFFRLQAEEKEEGAVRREALGSCQSWPRRHKAEGGQEAYRRACPGGGIPHSPTVGLVPAEA